MMNIKLGIDTGGSYTDAVVICYDTQEVIREAKALTTKEDLTIGIGKVIDKLCIKETENVCLVCLSTTLATNAIVEGKNSAVGLITIGASVKEGFPAAYSIDVKGRVSVTGCEVEPLCETEVEKALISMKGQVEALAISGYASVRNPAHELKVKELAEKILGIPVVCAHELTCTLGYYERTVTAVLNAKLIPIIKELVEATKTVLKQRNIDAQILIVKGNGHVMADSFAECRPVETILSGPAASMIGGRYLSGCRNAIIADMGGTTTDIVAVVDGVVPLEKDGASVGGWMTRVNAVQVITFGLGGDSYIRIRPFGTLSFGPDRVIPLCVAAHENPELCDEINCCRKEEKYQVVKRQETDCFRLFKKKNLDSSELTKQDLQIIKLLESGSHSILYLSREIGRDLDTLGMQKLLDMEIVQEISMTPTDLLHATGEYREWNEKASILGAELFAKRLNMDYSDFLVQAEEQFVYQISLALVQGACRVDGLKSDIKQNEAVMFIVNNALKKTENRHLDLGLRLTIPIIGIGAPAGTWFTKAAKVLGTELIIPDHNAVANAVGAAVGDMQEVFEALIRFNPHTNRFVAHTPKSRMLFKTLGDAKKFAKRELLACAEMLAQKLEVEGYKISITEKDCHFGGEENKDGGFIESRIVAVLSGVPRGGQCGN